MKVHIDFVFDDRSLRQIAQEGCGKRSGKATRQMCRLWLNKLVGSTLQTMNEPKVRRRRVSEDEWSHAATASMKSLAAEADAKCEHCGFEHQQHHGAKFYCPLSRSVKPGSKFKAVTK